MKPLWFITIFIQIVIKGCMESPAVRTLIIILTSTAMIIFVPYWVGLLVIGTVAGAVLPSPPWIGGLVLIIIICVVIPTLIWIYKEVYSVVKERMER